MLDPEQVWVDEFKKLPPAKTQIEGITNLANVIEKLTNKVDPLVPGGQAQPGVFKWTKAPFIAMMLTQQPTQGVEWAIKIADAWQAGCMAGIVTPALVTCSQWTVSTKDVNTIPVVATTVPTVAAGHAAIVGILTSIPGVVTATKQPAPEIFAKAFLAGVKAFTFVLIGIAGSPPSPVPLPITATAQ